MKSRENASIDLGIWEELTDKYYIDLFCGLFLNSGNEGLHLYPDSLVALGQRGIVLALEIYGPD